MDSTKIRSICNHISNNSNAIIDNLNKESIDVYEYIQKEFRKGEITKNHFFQFFFRSFYRLDNAGLKPEFKEQYFKLLNDCSENDLITMKEVLKNLYQFPNYKGQKTIQFSFVTKMFHTINPERPIYDNEVISVFGFNQPYYIKDVDKRIDIYLSQYEIIKTSYSLISKEELLRDIIKEFHLKFPNNNISNSMVLDFIFWSAGKLINKKQILPQFSI